MNNEQKVFDEFVATALGNSDEKLPAENIIVILTFAVQSYNAYCVFSESICLLFGNRTIVQNYSHQREQTLVLGDSPGRTRLHNEGRYLL